MIGRVLKPVPGWAQIGNPPSADKGEFARYIGRQKEITTKMTKEDIQLLYKYDRWANGRVLQAACVLSAEQFTADLGASLRSVRDALVHIVAGEWIWLEYWKEAFPRPTFLKDLRARRDVLFDGGLFPDVATVQQKWSEIEKEQITFLSSLTNELLEKMLPFRTTHVSLQHLMQHLANHSTYHRGQVALMMRQLGSQPATTDFHEFLLEVQQEFPAAVQSRS